MKSFDVVTKVAESPSSVTWGKKIGAGAVAALVIACSITVGCSSDKPKAANATSQIPRTPPHVAESSPAASSTEVAKAAPKKVVKKRSAVRTYKDKTYGVSFVYPRKYGVEVGDAANELIAGSPAPLSSDQPGGVALAAVELPEGSFPNTDFASAFFGVSVNKALTAEQCGFPEKDSAVKKITDDKMEQKVEDKIVAANDAAQAGSAGAGSATAPSAKSSSTGTASAATSVAPSIEAPAVEASSIKASSTESSAAVEVGKLKIGDAELLAKESVAGEGARQDDAKYYRTFQNGACYEFALNVTTVAKEEAGMKHEDRDKVFNRLEKILATVKIEAAVGAAVGAPIAATPGAAAPAPASETTAANATTASVPETPVQ